MCEQTALGIIVGDIGRRSKAAGAARARLAEVKNLFAAFLVSRAAVAEI